MAVPSVVLVPGCPQSELHVTKQPWLGEGKQRSGCVPVAGAVGGGSRLGAPEEPATCAQVRDDWGRVGLGRWQWGWI